MRAAVERERVVVRALLTAIVERHRTDLAEVESVEDVRQARRFNAALRMAVDGYSDTSVLERLQLIRTRAGEERSSNPRILEFDVLASRARPGGDRRQFARGAALRAHAATKRLAVGR